MQEAYNLRYVDFRQEQLQVMGSISWSLRYFGGLACSCSKQSLRQKQFEDETATWQSRTNKKRNQSKHFLRPEGQSTEILRIISSHKPIGCRIILFSDMTNSVVRRHGLSACPSSDYRGIPWNSPVHNNRFLCTGLLQWESSLCMSVEEGKNSLKIIKYVSAVLRVN